jgi:hypothetical protein
VRTLALCASLAVLALAPGAGGQPQTSAPGVLLSKRFLGVYRLTPAGGIHQLVGTDIRPLAVTASGTAAGVQASDLGHNGPLFLARGATRVELPHTGGGVWCVAFSADGSLVAYVSGKPVLTKVSPQLFYFRIDGTLWLADVANPQDARAIETGTFTVSECPLPAPAGQRFAYFVRNGSGDWELRLYRNSSVAPVADDPEPVPSNHDRSFAWAPNGTLAFVRGDELWLAFVRGDELWAGQRRIAAGLAAKLALKPKAQFSRAIDFSSNGRLLAVSMANKTGIFRLSGRLVRVVPGHLIDWSGSEGVLTIAETKQAIIVLYRFPLHGPGRVLARHFKLTAASDPAGAWFGYPISETGRFVFRRADGSLLRTVRLHYIGVPIAATDASGRLSLPAGSY